MTFKRPFKARIWAGISVLACAAALGACGSDDESTTDSQAQSQTGTFEATTTITAPTTTPAPAQPAKPKPKPSKGPPASLPSSGKNVVVPNVVGQTLTEAAAAMKQANLVMDAEALSGNRADIQASWVVCKTVPAAGRKTQAGSPVAVISAAPGQC